MAFGQNFTDTTYGYIGNGGVLISKLDANDRPVGGFFNVGQLSSAILALSSEKVEMQDMVYGTLGVAKSKVIRNTGELTLNLKSSSPDVMELVLFGQVTDDVAEVGATFTGKAYKGRSIIVHGVISAVTSVTGAAAAVLEEGVDYVVSDGSIEFLKDGTITDGDEVTVVYDKAAVRRIEGLVNTGVNVMVVFDGKNIAENDSPVKVTYYKMSLSPAAARQLVSADYGDLEIKGTLLTSRAVSGTGLSKMFKEEHVIAA
ncbi:hypothetical protein N7335_01910 [Stutzerimonas stutzeri]|uniref:Uncharacterized protein n=1 Tax=Stutzerimonas stutzeri TaxID=316 RepID=A0AA42H8I9_STUST|nr:hypothetical protein [Stutzerimonas stutzeri]MDH0145141.1 hypothetical protein [Stutzerimonas stutzeri]MDH0149604.1 hypothetical protein [Stutzerimonas stutzeri]